MNSSFARYRISLTRTLLIRPAPEGSAGRESGGVGAFLGKGLDLPGRFFGEPCLEALFRGLRRRFGERPISC